MTPTPLPAAPDLARAATRSGDDGANAETRRAGTAAAEATTGRAPPAAGVGLRLDITV